MPLLLLLLVRCAKPRPVQLPPFALADVTGETFTSRQVVTAATVFRNCAFTLCGDSSDGGGLYLNSRSLSLGLVSCLFVSCRSGALGGAWIASCLSLLANETSGMNCSAESCSFCLVELNSTAIGYIEMCEVSAASGASNSSTIYLSCRFYESGNTTFLHFVNSSANSASTAYRGSGLGVRYQFNLSLHFCTFSQNTRACCLYFSTLILNNDISCIHLLNNSCESDTSYPGLILVRSTLILSLAIFQRNMFDFFLGGVGSSSITIDFVECVFDFWSLSTTESISFLTTKCTYNTLGTSFAECGPWAPAPTTSEPQTPIPSQSASFTFTSEVMMRTQRVVLRLGLFTFAMVCR
jgi:hypothetical protein